MRPHAQIRPGKYVLIEPSHSRHRSCHPFPSCHVCDIAVKEIIADLARPAVLICNRVVEDEIKNSSVIYGELQ